jgi:hypothetical protein
LPYDEPDYESALLLLLDQTERVLTTFFRENLKVREMGVYVRFKDMSGHGESVRFPAAQFEPRVINPQVERLFRQLVACETQPIRQVCIHFWNMQPLDLQPKLFGGDSEFRRRELHHALEEIEARYGRRSVKTGTRLLLEKQGAHLVSEKAKCPFIPQREMEIKMDKVPEPMLDLIYEEESKLLEDEAPACADEAASARRRPAAPLPLPRIWDRSTRRHQKFL